MPNRGYSQYDGSADPLISKISASFRFYAQLNDFLPDDCRGQPIAASYTISPSIKDAIERLGVPHVEVDWILVNGRPVGFGYRVRPGDRVSVYPAFQSLDLGHGSGRLLPPPDSGAPAPRFVADVHLRKLSRLLRLLGLDVLHSPTTTDPQLVDISVREGRVLLTRDRALLKHGQLTQGLWIRSVSPREQAVEIVRRFNVAGCVAPFTRCPQCNGLLEPIGKADAMERIPPKTARWLEDYVTCSTCGKLYWQGTHAHRIHVLLEGILREAAPG
jgi:uncharacterized protein